METPDQSAFRVHGLNPERIMWLRHGSEYPAFFSDDWESLTLFWKGNCADRICVHNLAFDISFIPYHGIKDFSWWCSMIGLTDYCALPGKRGQMKWPKLGEARTKILETMSPPSETLRNEREIGLQICHNSLSDCLDLYSIVSRVIHNRPDIPDFRPVKNRFLLKGSGYYDHLPETCDPDGFVRNNLELTMKMAEITGNHGLAGRIRSFIADRFIFSPFEE